MALDPDISMSVPAGTRCAVCDYDLSGLTPDALCPECGCPIHRSLPISAGRLLFLSSVPPAQVQTLRAGLTLVGLGTVGWMIAWACAAVVLTLPDPSRWVWAPAACSLGATLSSYCGWLQVLLVESKPALRFEPLLHPAGRSSLVALRSIASAGVVLLWAALVFYPGAAALPALASAACLLFLYYQQGCLLLTSAPI